MCQMGEERVAGRVQQFKKRENKSVYELCKKVGRDRLLVFFNGAQSLTEDDKTSIW